MSTVDFSAFAKRETDYGPLAEMVSTLRASIIAEVQREIASHIATAIATAFKEHGTPNVKVDIPPLSPIFSPQVAVDVPPPKVDFNPTIEVDSPVVHVNPQIDVPGMAEMAAQLARVHADLTELIALAKKPVYKDVERDGQYITRVTEHR